MSEAETMNTPANEQPSDTADEKPQAAETMQTEEHGSQPSEPVEKDQDIVAQPTEAKPEDAVAADSSPSAPSQEGPNEHEPSTATTAPPPQDAAASAQAVTQVDGAEPAVDDELELTVALPGRRRHASDDEREDSDREEFHDAASEDEDEDEKEEAVAEPVAPSSGVDWAAEVEEEEEGGKLLAAGMEREGATGEAAIDEAPTAEAEAKKHKPREPFEVPTQGPFWLHDDRFDDEEAAAQQLAEERRRRAAERKAKADTDGRWLHDKFEQLDVDDSSQDDRFTSFPSSRRGGSPRGRSYGRGRGDGPGRGGYGNSHYDPHVEDEADAGGHVNGHSRRGMALPPGRGRGRGGRGPRGAHGELSRNGPHEQSQGLGREHDPFDVEFPALGGSSAARGGGGGARGGKGRHAERLPDGNRGDLHAGNHSRSTASRDNQARAAAEHTAAFLSTSAGGGVDWDAPGDSGTGKEWNGAPDGGKDWNAPSQRSRQEPPMAGAGGPSSKVRRYSKMAGRAAAEVEPGYGGERAPDMDAPPGMKPLSPRVGRQRAKQQPRLSATAEEYHPSNGSVPVAGTAQVQQAQPGAQNLTWQQQQLQRQQAGAGGTLNVQAASFQPKAGSRSGPASEDGAAAGPAQPPGSTAPYQPQPQQQSSAPPPYSTPANPMPDVAGLLQSLASVLQQATGNPSPYNYQQPNQYAGYGAPAPHMDSGYFLQQALHQALASGQMQQAVASGQNPEQTYAALTAYANSLQQQAYAQSGHAAGFTPAPYQQQQQQLLPQPQQQPAYQQTYQQQQQQQQQQPQGPQQQQVVYNAYPQQQLQQQQTSQSAQLLPEQQQTPPQQQRRQQPAVQDAAAADDYKQVYRPQPQQTYQEAYKQQQQRQQQQAAAGGAPSSAGAQAAASGKPAGRRYSARAGNMA